MKFFFSKLLFGTVHSKDWVKEDALLQARNNLRSIWNNDHSEDNGLEKIFRLLLAISPFLFPGIYIKQWFGGIGRPAKDLAMDVYILFKMLFPLMILYFNQSSVDACFYISMWLVLETTLYVPSLIFASDALRRPKSYRRSMMMLFFNYLEIIFSFGLIYSRESYLNQPFVHWFDPVYYSFITMATVGYGDFYPVTAWGKALACFQTVFYLIFVVLFLNLFSHQVEYKGYFGRKSD